MDGLQRFFENLTQPQADLINSAVTLMSAILVVIVAPLVFHLLASKGLRDFRAAVAELRETANSTSAQATAIRASIMDVTKDVREFAVLLSSLQEGVANTQNALIEEQAEETPSANGAAAKDNRERVKELWRELRECVEQAASRTSINGRTRSRYARIDRRSYFQLIEALHADGNLGGPLTSWRKAYDLANTARNRNGQITGENVQEMAMIAGSLLSVAIPPETEPAPTPPAPPRRPRGDAEGAPLH